ncbi:MAG: OmpH family outer membrane protein [Sphingobium sp.]|nr:OmpH family outer membrane protein [Sphingobium sp.]MBP6111193.1 OmpH family outer membrane protein [Sphingobium sp.]MBP8671687.1 OmpH family outer membrane protein [Sphingobium sp.]MBP9157181.1 OmpH family outer membrane protein [Sphingobium sp.]MCC6483050.1 OmpH family outer membrane protein [Sphingomonadaceae bacterium]
MTYFSKVALAATPALALALAAAPAQAQVGGIATASTIVAIAKAKALIPAYQQIDGTYKSYYDQIQTKSKERNDLLVRLDKNGDKKVDQAEMDGAVAAKDPNLALVDAKEKEMAVLQEPIAKAQMYVVSQIIGKYPAAQQAVVTAKKINMILAPDAFVWAPPAVDVTTAITAEIDRVLPTATTTAPAGWNPDQQTYEVYQRVQQMLAAAMQAQAARAQAPAAPAAPASGKAAPTGR